MTTSLWPLLNALQGGALLALTLSFGAEGLARRDRVMQRLAASCLLVALRHGVLALGEVGGLPAELVLHLQSLLVCLGFIALLGAFHDLFPEHLPEPLPAWAALAFLPNFARNLFLDSHHPWDRPLHNTANLVYIGLSLYLVARVWKARQEGVPMAQRLLWGLVGVAIPVLVEALVETVTSAHLRLSGFSLLYLAAFLGASWHWGLTTALERRAQHAETEAQGWRRLVPGPWFRLGAPNALMEDLLGREWEARVQAPTTRDRQGRPYAVHLNPDTGCGWLESLSLQAQPEAFLRGWSVALALPEGPEAAAIEAALKAWGAAVEHWGTLPPREGPYPSLLLWGREPSILNVWREDDLVRRRCRWIQVGGPRIEGPHAWLESPVTPAKLEPVLRGLLSL